MAHQRINIRTRQLTTRPRLEGINPRRDILRQSEINGLMMAAARVSGPDESSLLGARLLISCSDSEDLILIFEVACDQILEVALAIDTEWTSL